MKQEEVTIISRILYLHGNNEDNRREPTAMSSMLTCFDGREQERFLAYEFAKQYKEYAIIARTRREGGSHLNIFSLSFVQLNVPISLNASEKNDTFLLPCSLTTTPSFTFNTSWFTRTLY